MAEHSFWTEKATKLSLGIFFGSLGAEVEGPLLDNGTLSPNAHPSALQLKADLQSLKDIEPGRELIQAWQGNMRKLVMDERMPHPIL